MKKFLTFMLIFVIVFPANCFANPQGNTFFPQELMDEIISIVENRLIEKEEVGNLKLTLDEISTVSPSQLGGETCVQAILLSIAYLWLAIEAEENEVMMASILYLIINITRAVYLC